MSSTSAQSARPHLKVVTEGHQSNPSVPPSSFVPPSILTTEISSAQNRTSVFRSSQIEVHIYSATIRTLPRREHGVSRSLPVFGDRDKVDGVVHLDPRLSAIPGRLTVSMEGAFVYISPFSEDSGGAMVAYPAGKHRHLFFSSSVSFTSGETVNNVSPRSASSLRDAFSVTRRSRKVDRRPSLPELATSQPRAYQFSFEIPKPSRPGEEMPPTFSTVAVGDIGLRRRTAVERAEVEYKVVAMWESNDSTEHARLDSPILFQPDTDFQSLDGLSLEPESWLEIPLRSDRPIPFKCAITLPVPSTFPHSASIPFFVVFTTTPRNTMFAREIAMDSTIAVSLLRQVTILTSRPWSSPLSGHLSTPSVSSGDETEGSSTTRRRILRRVAMSASPVFGGNRDRTAATNPSSRKQASNGSSHFSASQDKPLPDLPPNPPPGLLETRTLQTDVSIGFPKRPRQRVDPNQRHPSLDQHSSLPDGLYKGKMRLSKNMLPVIDWAGLSVKYFLEVSVLSGQDELRARIPIRIF